MGVYVLWLATLALTLPAVSQCTPLYVLTAPNILRLGAPEKVFVEAQGYDGNDLNVDITVKNFPEKNIEILSKTVILSKGNNFQAVQEILIPESDFVINKNSKQYVYLHAKFQNHVPVLEKAVLVTFESGYLFTQTDKPVYTPEDTVRYRVFAMSPDLEPITNGVTVEIMNPDGVTITENFMHPNHGVISGNYKLPEIVRTGTWKVVCGFGKGRENLYTTEFEVKEYVLPSFEVKLVPRKSFFHVNDTELIVDITAKYLYGKDVSGKAFVLFGVMSDDEKRSIPASLQRVNIELGKGEAKLTKEHILATFEDITKLIEQSLFVSVSVLTESGSEMVEAEKRGIQIVTSPYTIRFKKTPNYFKPGMPFDALVYVTNPDNSPAKGIDVEEVNYKVSGVTNENGEAKLTINTPDGLRELLINVKTKVSKLSEDQQAQQSMVARPYRTKSDSKNYLHISLRVGEMKAGGPLSFQLFLPNAQEQIKDVTYLIMSKGRLLRAKRFKRETGQSLIAINDRVTKDMIPSFRLVAYYHVGTEVVSDSVWVDVQDTCMGTLSVKAEDERNFSPRMPFTLKITGDPGASVGLVAVDRGVYVVSNKTRLTQTKIWDIVEKQDIGCTTGSGANSTAVFYDAGLVFVSNADSTKARAERTCPLHNKRRRRRSLSLMELKHSLVKNYTGQVRQCCLDGMVDNLMEYTCERRAQYIGDGEECVKAFLHCCSKVEQKTQEARTEDLLYARSDDSGIYFDEFSEISSRTQFPESWLWEDLVLPSCPDKRECESTSIEKRSYMKDSITTWEVTAISVSKTHGICVADPYEMRVMKSFFIDLKLPYAVVRNEQLEIKAVLYNYIDSRITARVQLTETEHVCSVASRKGKYLLAEVEVDKMSSRAVPFVIIPMAVGLHSIEVKAYVVDLDQRDGIRKDLRVVAEGQRTELQVKSVQLNPSAYGGVQSETINPVPLRSIIPDSTPQTHISATGDLLSQTIDAVISGKDIGHLIQRPYGCGEQNMMRITGPVIATIYLDKTKQWDKAGLDRRAEALTYIMQGYNQQFSYRISDGSYSIYSRSPRKPSTWLTAYVAKVFGLASNLVPIQGNIICTAVKWLILNTQMPDGTFHEVGRVYSSELMGGLTGRNPEVGLTAFVLIAMQQTQDVCQTEVSSLTSSRLAARQFLEQKIHTLNDVFAVTLASCALANEGQHHLDILNSFSSVTDNGTYWEVPGSHTSSLEATGYALMALVKAKRFDQAGRVVKWLTEQKFYGVHYGSTQATVIVFQAIALYMMELQEKRETDLTVTLSTPGRHKPIIWTYKPETMHVTRSTKIPRNQNLTFTVKGTGQGTLTVMTVYNALPEDSKDDCKNFELEITLKKQPPVDDPFILETYILTIEMLFLSSERSSTMAILDITMLSGFIADKEDLEKLTSGTDQYVKRMETNTQLSEKGSLILYLDTVSNQLSDKVAFRVHKMNDVGLLQPAAVVLYEYNSIESRCMKFYHPKRTDGALNKICHKDVCRCAEENCSFQRKENKDLDRVTIACSHGMDYVYKVKVIEADLAVSIDRFTILVEDTIKEGTDTGVNGKERMFLAHPYCRDAISLIKGKTYLIMGQHSSLIMEGDSIIYMLGGGTWIEYWPTQTECQESEHRSTCMSVLEDTEDLTTFGCPN
ncbi:hypothetical protein GJAV_G00265900 [Gymnothorax javanicus]|nr:hypothetical protein GJAV_G00265900 [Gymnothorax javanicus]